MELLKNKVCLVTGCNRGIGAEIVNRFAQEGAIVYAVARMPNCIDEKCEQLSIKYNTPVIPLYFDVTDDAMAKKAVMQIKKEQNRLDVLVNNAGVMKDALIGMIDRNLMTDTFETNVFAVINMIQLVSRLMCRQKNGSIINLTSISGTEGNPGQIVYSASKGAVIALTKTASKELAPNNVRVNAIAPGMIDTDMFRSIDEEKTKVRSENIRMGRIGTPLDVANTAVYLASDLSKYVCGQIIGVNGSAII